MEVDDDKNDEAKQEEEVESNQDSTEDELLQNLLAIWVPTIHQARDCVVEHFQREKEKADQEKEKAAREKEKVASDISDVAKSKVAAINAEIDRIFEVIIKDGQLLYEDDDCDMDQTCTVERWLRHKLKLMRLQTEIKEMVSTVIIDK